MRDVVLFSLLAFAVPLLTQHLGRGRLPVVAGEILIGALFGRSGLHWLTGSPIVSFLSVFGLAYLMFLSGLEIDTGRLRALLYPSPSVGRGPRPRWLLAFPLLVGGLSLAVGLELRTIGVVRHGVFLALLLASSAPTVVLPVLKNASLVRQRFGQIVLSLTILGDFLALLAVTVSALIWGTGQRLRPLWGVALLVLGAALVYFGPRLRQWWRREVRLHGSASEVGVRAALAVVTVFIALAQAVGIASVLGAFVAGLGVGAVVDEDRPELQSKLDAMGYGYFIPFFFLDLGRQLDLGALVRSPSALLLVPALTLAFGLVTMPPVLLLRLWFPWRPTWAAGLLLSTRLSVTVAGAAIFLQAGLLAPQTGVAVVLASVLSAVVYPAFFTVVLRGEATGEPPRSAVVLGSSRLARVVVAALRRAGFRVQADEDANDLLASPPDVLLALQPAAADNLEDCRAARERWGPLPSIALVDAEDEALEARAAGVVPFRPEAAQVGLLVAFARSSALTDTILGPGELEVHDVPVLRLPRGVRRVGDLRLPDDVLVLSVVSGGDRRLARGTTPLQVGDILAVIGPPAAVEAVQALFGHEVPA